MTPLHLLILLCGVCVGLVIGPLFWQIMMDMIECVDARRRRRSDHVRRLAR